MVKINRLNIVKNLDSVRAYVDFLIDDGLLITGSKLVYGKNGLFMQFPTYKDKDGKFNKIIYPITAEFKNKIEKLVIDSYEAQLKLEEGMVMQ